MSFFIFAGYYVGLSLILSTGNITLSRFYTLPIRIIMFLTAIIYLLSFSSRKFKIINIDILMFVLFSFYSLKVIYTETILNKISLLHEWYHYIFYFLLFNYSVYIFFRNINVKKYLNLIINTLTFAGFLLGIFIILLYRDVLFASQVGRFGATVEGNEGEILNPLSVAYSGAMNVSLLIPYMINNFKNKSILIKVYYLANFFISMFLFVMGSTRGAFVVVVVSMLLFVFSQYGLKKIKYILYILPIIPIFFIYLDYTGSSLIERLTHSVENHDSSGRDELWGDAFAEFVNNPIIGGKVEVSGYYPHNILLEVLMSMGGVGLIIFCMIIFVSFNKLKLDKSTLYIYIIFVNGMFQYMFSSSLYMAIILFFSVGLASGYKRFLDNKISK